MKHLTRIKDNKINALKAIFEVSIEEYIKIANDVVVENEYQRGLIRDTKTVYNLLRNDLKTGCTIPPIVLAVKEGTDISNVDDFKDEDIEELLKSNNLIILDGLQRTNAIFDVYKELTAEEDKDKLDIYKKQSLIIECYIGINKIGILYRMLTLNTGQTKMSLRHQIEILYSGLIDERNNKIHFHKQVDNNNKIGLTDFQLKEAIDCFYSYITLDQNGIDREDILDTVSELEKLSKQNQQQELFKNLILSYSNIMSVFATKMNDTEKIVSLFNRSVAMSSYGAAVGDAIDCKIIEKIEDINNRINNTDIQSSFAQGIELLKDKLEKIRVSAKKIGVEQRAFFYYFFKYLISTLVYDKTCDLDKVVKQSYSRYKSI